MNRRQVIVLFVVAVALLLVRFTYKKVQATQWQSQCIRNLHTIVLAKQVVAEQEKLPLGASVREGQVAAHIVGYGEEGRFVCPAGGDYTVNPLGSNPVCSVHGPARSP